MWQAFSSCSFCVHVHVRLLQFYTRVLVVSAHRALLAQYDGAGDFCTLAGGYSIRFEFLVVSGRVVTNTRRKDVRLTPEHA